MNKGICNWMNRGRNNWRAVLLVASFLLSGLFGCGKEAVYTAAPGNEALAVQAEQFAKGMQTEDYAAEAVDGITQEGGNESSAAAAESKENAIGKHPEIYVHVCGAVKEPGVYTLSEDARVFEAIKAAGGVTSDACEEALNQAELLKDGQRIYILTKNEWEEEKETAEQASDGLVNINTADESGLCELPGVGGMRARAIIQYRQEHGSFQAIEDIQNVPGIKSGLFEKIKDYIKTE